MLPLAPGARAWDETLSLKAASWGDVEAVIRTVEEGEDPGVTLRAAIWRAEGPSQGLALLLPGRTEFLEKAAITAAGLVERGFDVASLDWRGQGLSDRLVEPGLKGHVESFRAYELDLAALLAAPEVAACGPVRVVLAHSMGASVALGARSRGILPAVPIVLSAPLVEIALRPPVWAASVLTIAVARMAGTLDRWPPGRGHEVPYVLQAEARGNLLTHDRAVWDWLGLAAREAPELAIAMPTLAWLDAALSWADEAKRLAPWPAPALAIVGTGDAVIDRAAVAALAERIGAGLHEIEGARHEPFIEAAAMRAEAWAAVDRFLAGAGL